MFAIYLEVNILQNGQLLGGQITPSIAKMHISWNIKIPISYLELNSI